MRKQIMPVPCQEQDMQMEFPIGGKQATNTGDLNPKWTAIEIWTRTTTEYHIHYIPMQWLAADFEK